MGVSFSIQSCTLPTTHHNLSNNATNWVPYTDPVSIGTSNDTINSVSPTDARDITHDGSIPTDVSPIAAPPIATTDSSPEVVIQSTDVVIQPVEVVDPIANSLAVSSTLGTDSITTLSLSAPR